MTTFQLDRQIPIYRSLFLNIHLSIVLSNYLSKMSSYYYNVFSVVLQLEIGPNSQIKKMREERVQGDELARKKRFTDLIGDLIVSMYNFIKARLSPTHFHTPVPVICEHTHVSVIITPLSWNSRKFKILILGKNSGIFVKRIQT